MKKYVIFDFDGVLVESNDIRINGFIELFSGYSKKEIEMFLDWAIPNGGISRYDKIRYFFNEIRKENIKETEVNIYARKYSEIVKQKVIDAPGVKGAENFLKKYFTIAEFHLLSASDGCELNEICKARNLYIYFKTISGSPKNKKENLGDLISINHWNRQDCLYIGDSINDYEAARSVGIDFMGRNSGIENWTKYDVYGFNDFTQIDFINYFERLIKS